MKRLIYPVWLLLLLSLPIIAQTVSALSQEAGAGDEISESSPGIFVIGGTRATGYEVVKRLVERGEKVTVLVRPTSDLTNLEKLDVETVVGDAMDLESLKSAMSSGDFRLVFSSLGGKGADGVWVDAPGTRNALEAALSAGIPYYFMISTIGAGDSADAVPWYYKMILRSAIERKNISEEYVVESGLEYTIIRPGGLTNDSASGKGQLTEDQSVMGWISRAELARLIVEAMYDPDSRNRIYSAVESDE